MMPQKVYGYNRQLWEIVKSHPFQILAVILLSLMGMLFAIVSPLIMRTLIDDVLIGKNTGLFVPVLIVMTVIYFTSAVSEYLSARIKGTLGILLFSEFSKEIFDRIQRTDLKGLQQIKTGDLQVRTAGNVGTIIQTVTNTLPQILVTILGVFLPFIIMFSLNAEITMVLLFPLALFIFSSWHFGNKMKDLQRPALDSSASLQSFLKEAYSTIPLIKVFRLENWVYGKYNKNLSRYSDTSVEVVKLASMNSAISLLIYGIPSVLVLILGGFAVIQNTMTIGTLTAFIGYVGLFFSPIQILSILWNKYKSSHASYDRVSEILELNPDYTGDKPLVVTKGDIQFEGVRFSYGDRIILNNFNASFTRGRNYLIGDNGSGKTTIVRLLCGLYSPDYGKISIDNQDLSCISRDSLRTVVSVVFADSLFFDCTIAENILFGNLTATKEEMILAAKKAELHEFVMKLPSQYDTIVGEAGLNLSSGEKQKIALVRVILRDSPIIVFDEFTRSIDIESKKSIYSVIKQLNNKTIIIITHDMNDIEPDGRIVVLERNGVPSASDPWKIPHLPIPGHPHRDKITFLHKPRG